MSVGVTVRVKVAASTCSGSSAKGGSHSSKPTVPAWMHGGKGLRLLVHRGKGLRLLVHGGKGLRPGCMGCYVQMRSISIGSAWVGLCTL